MIYINGKEVKPYVGDYKPLTVYKGTEKLAGWTEQTLDNIKGTKLINAYSTMKISPYGKSEQTQTEQSANLADANVLYRQMEEFNNNELSEKTVDGKECIEFKNSLYRNDQGFAGLQGNYKENTQYTVRGLFRISDTSITSGKKIYFGVVYTDDTRNTVATEANGENWTELRILTSADKTLKGVYFTYDQASLWLLDKSSLCIAEGNVTEYPAFTPDSPSPNYPSKIENVSGDLLVKATARNILPRTFAEDLLKRLNVSSLDAYLVEIDGKNYFKYPAQLGYQTGKNYFIKDVFEESTQYVFKLAIMKNDSETSRKINIGIEYTDGRFVGLVTSVWTNMTEKEVTIISDENKTIKEIGISYNSGITYINLDKYILCKLEAGMDTSKLEYEPYKEQVVTFPLGEQKLMQGGYLGDDGIHNKRKQVVLDGTEVWTLSGRQFEKCACFHIGIDNNPKINMLCNAFKYNQMAYNNSSDEECITNNVKSGIQNIIIVQIDKTRLTTQDVAGFKAWLAEQYSAGTPVIVEYEMQEEEITPYTEQQQTAYNNLQKLKTYRTTTNISNNQNTNMKIIYKINN